MCSRYGFVDGDKVVEHFGVSDKVLVDFNPKYNIGLNLNTKLENRLL